MALGPGKYDALATLVSEGAKADGVVVIVMAENAGRIIREIRGNGR